MRGSLRPEIGLRTHGTLRRVPGLRREELAQLAGVSTGYYTRLEQGQAETASEQVLDALARVLRLDQVETVHLHNPARQSAKPGLSEPPPEEPHPRVLRLLESLGEATPAIVLGRRGDVLAWNRTGHALVAEHVSYEDAGDLERRPSIPRMFFLDPHTVNVDYQVWLQPDSPDHRVELYTANDSTSSDAVRVLAQQSGRADEREPVVRH